MRILHVGWGFSPWRPGGLIAYVEDLMAAQLERRHEVSYFLSGRHFPYVSGPRLKRWRRGGIAMHEVINSPIVAGLEYGTRRPDLDLAEPRTEAVFRSVLTAVRPHVLHIHELQGLPSSLLDIAAEAGVPRVMTLHDYGPLCATLRLFDADDRICMRRQIGVDCVARNAQALPDSGALIWATLQYEVTRFWRLLRPRSQRDFSRLGPMLLPLLKHATRQERERTERAPRGFQLAAAFQHRRDTNVTRLAGVDRLVGQSPRVAQIYRDLGVTGDNLISLPSTLTHIERLRPRAFNHPPAPIRFATLNGCASPSKGSRTVVAALRTLRETAAGARFELHVFGHVDEEVRAELLGHREVLLRGLYRRDELDALLDDMDVGIMPSMWEESYGYTGLEFVAKGIPLIANPLGGIVEYARDGETAWINHSCGGEELARLMSQLISEPARVVDMHRRLLAVRDQLILPMKRHVDDLDGIYREVARLQ